ncbi:16910_t:CDS:2, partial [Gigaspora margarita]
PTRQFLKDVLNFKMGAKWRAIAAVKEIEPLEEETEHVWSVVWNRIRSNNGSRCLSMRRADIYKSASCILCDKDQIENQVHLAKCEAQEENWVQLEENAISVAWAMLSENTRKFLSKEEFHKIMWSVSIEERYIRRTGVIKGIIQQKVQSALLGKIKSRKECKEAITNFINAAWNGFYIGI